MTRKWNQQPCSCDGDNHCGTAKRIGKSTLVAYSEAIKSGKKKDWHTYDELSKELDGHKKDAVEYTEQNKAGWG